MMNHMRSQLVPMLVLAVVASAVVPATAAGAAAKAGRGCGKTATSGVTTRSLNVDATTRDYLLSIPPAYDASKHAPVILNFHGLGSNKEQQALYSGMNQKAATEGYVVITPDASEHVPCEGVAETYVSPSGSVSVTVAAWASEGPELDVVIV